jgi:23S rRNA (uracil1939-C5)-methyltransferase
MSLLKKTITLKIEKPAYGGSSIGFHEHKVILVPYAVPGDTLLVKINEEKKDYCVGNIESYISEEGARIKPACSNFKQCGGCSYLHLPYQAELMLKQIILKDNLSRIAGLPPESTPDIEILYRGRFYYRSHAEFKVNGGLPGFYRKGSNVHIPVSIEGCCLLAKEINSFIKNNILPGNGFKIAMDSNNRIATSFFDEPVVTEVVNGFSYKRGLDEFFQVNRFIRPDMMKIVGAYAALSQGDTFLDIGCGVGFFSLYLAGNSSHGTGIDINGESIRWAKHNARLNDVDNVDFLAVPASHIHPVRHYADVVVIDPPRAGMDRKTRKTIITMKPQRIVYISCNPSTFSRDAKNFIRAGYDLAKITLVDMFPCTHHIEVISLFNRR